MSSRGAPAVRWRTDRCAILRLAGANHARARTLAAAGDPGQVPPQGPRGAAPPTDRRMAGADRVYPRAASAGPAAFLGIVPAGEAALASARRHSSVRDPLLEPGVGARRRP